MLHFESLSAGLYLPMTSHIKRVMGVILSLSKGDVRKGQCPRAKHGVQALALMLHFESLSAGLYLSMTPLFWNLAFVIL